MELPLWSNPACQDGIGHIREMPPAPAMFPGLRAGCPGRPLNGARNPCPYGVWFHTDWTGGEPKRVISVPPTAVTNGWLPGSSTWRL